MKKPIAIKLEATYEEIRVAYAIISGKSITDEEIENMFFNRDLVEVGQYLEDEKTKMIAVFVAFILGHDMGREEKPVTKTKSKFQQRLDEAKAERNKKLGK